MLVHYQSSEPHNHPNPQSHICPVSAVSAESRNRTVSADTKAQVKRSAAQPILVCRNLAYLNAQNALTAENAEK